MCIYLSISNNNKLFCLTVYTCLLCIVLSLHVTSETSLLTQLTSQYRKCQFVGTVLPTGELQHLNNNTLHTALTSVSTV
jgi:hypothetical protein